MREVSVETVRQYIISRVSHENGCWLWKLAKDGGGYGIGTLKGRTCRPHRLAYEAFVGEIPQGMMVCHTCDVRHCCNPDHLWVGTGADNTADMIAKGRKAVVRTCKLQPEEVDEIRSLIGTELQRDIARRFNVARTTISAIATGRSWSHE